jgi:hypothetical protein
VKQVKSRHSHNGVASMLGFFYEITTLFFLRKPSQRHKPELERTCGRPRWNIVPFETFRFHAGLELMIGAFIKATAACLAAFFFCGCGGRSSKLTTIRSEQVFNLAMTGQTWIFQNGYGDKTFISLEQPPLGTYSGCSVWHYTKDNARAYWQPGVAGADLHFVLCRQADGTWMSKAILANLPPLLLTQNVGRSGDGKIPYLIIPRSASEGSVVSDDTSYISFILFGSMTWESIESSVQPTSIDWRTDSSIEFVSTPVYSGPALVSEQWESYSGPCFPPGQHGCAHEKWYFAPRIGLVRVVPIDIGAGTLADPNLVMVRIR